MDGTVGEPVIREVRLLVRVFARLVEVQLDAETGVVARVQQAVLPGVGLLEHGIGLRPVLHVLLNSEIVDGEPEVHGRRHAHRRDVGGPVHPRLDLVLGRVIEQLFEVGDPAGVRHGATHVVDELLADEQLVVPHRIEDLADRERGGGVLTDEPQRLLVLRRRAVLEPEQVVRFEGLAELCGLDGCHPVVAVVQQRKLRTELVAYRLEHRGKVTKVGAGVPVLLGGERSALGGLVVVTLTLVVLAHLIGGDAVDRLQPWNAGLDTDGAVALLLVAANAVEDLLVRLSGCMAVGEKARAARSPSSW